MATVRKRSILIKLIQKRDELNIHSMQVTTSIKVLKSQHVHSVKEGTNKRKHYLDLFLVVNLKQLKNMGELKFYNKWLKPDTP